MIGEFTTVRECLKATGLPIGICLSMFGNTSDPRYQQCFQVNINKGPNGYHAFCTPLHSHCGHTSSIKSDQWIQRKCDRTTSMPRPSIPLRGGGRTLYKILSYPL